MEFLGKKRKGTDVIPTSRNNLKSLTFILSHLSLEDYSRQRKKYKEEIVIETVASCKSVVNGAVTAPPFVGICSDPPSRGLKRKIGCIDAATRLGRKKKIEQEYDLGAMIGKGKFGLVVLCRSKASGQQFACKTLRKRDEIVHREVEIMQHLSGHPGVVTLKAVYEDTESFHLVMELCSGGRLLDQMTRGKRDLSENELVGPIPPILGNLSYTGKLYLHGNKFTGPIPPELGNMSKLSYLQLNGNQLVGGIPAELGKLEQLFELGANFFGGNLANNNLEGPIPHNISSCTALNQLNVYGNRLSGSIPRGFQSLESLTYLNLSSNHFKGSIPVELGRIINLDTLDLSSNNFLGPVPAAIGDLEHLLTLNLSHNHLNGPIPSEFGILRSIQIIILNNNNLRGEIPDQLTNCLSLATLDCYDKLVSFLLYWFRISVPKYLWILLDALRSRF